MEKRQSPDFSVVSPVYGCRESLGELVTSLENVFDTMNKSFEIILVDDRCPQDSWETIEKLATTHAHVQGIRLSRNFGQHAAIEAGLKYAEGEWVIVMDCDLQDQPGYIPDLYQKALEGYDIVRARRSNRTDSLYRRTISRLFYWFLEKLTMTRQDPAIANFGIYNRKVIKAILDWDEQVRFFPAIVQWVGFDHAEVNVRHSTRHSGHSTYNFKKLLNLAISVALSFSDRPLRLTVSLGLLVVLLAMGIGVFVFIKAIITKTSVEGWTSLILSIWFLGGVLISIIGMSGLYIGQTLFEAKKRPVYIIDKRTGVKE